MKRSLVSALMAAGLSVVVTGWTPVRGESPVSGTDPTAQAQALQTEAIKAIRAGEWTRTSELISKAADISRDPSLAKMSKWLSEFESQRQTFASERKTQYDEVVGDVQKLVDAGHHGIAMEAAARAYVLSPNKDDFGKLGWVKDLSERTAKLAEEAEQESHWLRAARLYSSLASIQPTSTHWREQLKSATRRVRIIATYAPKLIEQEQETETKLREAAEAVLKPTTQPTTRPVSESNEAFKTDWHDSVKGIELKMLRDALRNARLHYWKSKNYKDLLPGGIEGLRAIAATKGLEGAFPKLADEGKREAFIAACNAQINAVVAAQSATDDSLMTRTLAQMWQANVDTIELPEEVFTAEFADGAFGRLDDFTNMIWPTDIEEFNKSTQGEFQGVGIQIDLDDEGNLLVVSPIEDTPAYRAGIKAGDKITHINGKISKGITVSQAIKNITGPEGTKVRLTVRSPDGASKEYELKRAKIQVNSIKGWVRLPGGAWDYLIDKDNKIGYFRMTNFTKSTVSEMNKALADMQALGARAVILDLRGNPGGLLNAATEVSDRFVSGGTIVSTKSERRPQDEQVTTARADADDINLPMIVLVNQLSASASEIVSGCLRDQKRALVVGERTFGKGSVQMLFEVDDRAAFLKLTTSHYYLPNGECIHKEDGATTWGVEPDVTVSITEKQARQAGDIRRAQDVLRDAEAPPSTQPMANALDVDPQLSAAVLLLRLQLAGAKI